jgi:GAF domain-containing protein
MGREFNRAKRKASPAPPGKAQKPAAARIRDLEQRLAEAAEQLQTRDRELAEAQEQLTAASEILRVISSSPTDYQPVFDTIVRRAGVVCGAVDAILWTVDGEELVVRAHHGPIPATIGARQPMQGSVAGGAARHARVVHVEDLSQSDEFPVGRALARRIGWRTTLSVPLLRAGVAIGAILVRRSEVRPFTERQIALLQTFADEAVIALENVRLFNETKEALERQTATSEILRVIAGSPTDVQPVFAAIMKNALRLCSAQTAAVLTFDGHLIHAGAFLNITAEAEARMRRRFPRAPDRSSAAGRAILTGDVAEIPDVEADSEYVFAADVRAGGLRSNTAVPMLRDGRVIGTINLGRNVIGGFSESEIALLRIFADQAVIAIENVRLFNETKEALDRQTATAEILRVIASSPTDLQPVLNAVAESATRVCAAEDAVVMRVEGDAVHPVAYAGTIPPTPEFVGGRRLSPRYIVGRAILERRTIHVGNLDDVLAEYPEAIPEFRTILAAPLVRDGAAVGAIVMRRHEVRPFTDKQIALLQTFADQAVIAIENVRLFTELDASNKHLTDALDKQTATSDILRAISRSQTDVRPVFDEILSSAVRLMDAQSGTLTRITGDHLDLAAFKSTDTRGDATLRAAFPLSLQVDGIHAQAIRARTPVNIGEAQNDTRELARSVARARGYQSQVAVPLLHHEAAFGTISVARRASGGFTEDEIALLQTFADQAVIAIENARLLSELQARTGELGRSVEQLTALSEVGRAVSSTLDLETVLTTIVSRAVELSGLDGGVVFEYDEGAEEFVHRVATQAGGALAEARRSTRIRKGEGAVGRTALTLEPAQVPDITVPGAYESRLRENLITSGIRAVLAVPMVREGELIGCLVVSRNLPGEFTADIIELLRTFATQSALAIQNARLFREIEIKSRELEAASRHKSEFLANMSHELRTPLNAIIGFSEILSERMFGELNEKQDEYLKDIHASGQHLLSLINDILDLSKIEAGKMELELSSFDLPTTIDNALVLVRERASRRGIALGKTVDERLGLIEADERKLRQVLLNLLSNAIKFTPEGGRIDVRAVPMDGSVSVSVTDTGVGIAPEDQEAVFEEFRQVGSADKRVGGTGLGLALSRKFIELHGGRIWVKSQVGAGSCFTFEVPARRGG